MELRSSSVTHGFGGDGRPYVAVLDDLDLTVEIGEFVAMVGPSGAGKSTLLRMFAGMLEPDRGVVSIGDEPVAGRTDLVAYQPQRDLLLPWRRVLDNTTLAAEAAGIPRKEARSLAAEALERFGLGEFTEAWPSELSGGMRQRVALLRTHLSPRPVMLLDEPLGSLDALTRRVMQRWVAELQAAHRRTTLLVTHDIEEALLLADRVVVLSPRPARVVAEFASPWPHPRVRGLELTPEFIDLRAEILSVLTPAVET